MARPREFDTDEAVAQIATQFWADGYEATGIADLEQATGLARASLYAAFGPKNEMLYRSIDWYLDGQIEMRAALVESGGLDSISHWFKDFVTVRERVPEMASRGCLLVNATVELGETDPGVVERGDRYRSRIQGAFRAALMNAEAAGEIDGDIEERANHCYLLLLGLFVSIRGGASQEEITQLSGAAVGAVESWCLS